MNRPMLTPALSPDDFRAWYWLKNELQNFCSEDDLPTTGNKEELSLRVQAHLSGVLLQNTPKTSRSARGSPMPQELSQDTVIGSGWRLNYSVRSFL